MLGCLEARAIMAGCLECMCFAIVPVPLMTKVVGQYLHLHVFVFSISSKCNQVHDFFFFTLDKDGFSVSPLD